MKLRTFLILIVSFVCFFSCSSPTPLSIHGRLSVKNLQLVDQTGKPFQLRGMSTQNYSATYEWTDFQVLHELVSDWHANLIRLAIYIRPMDGGFVANPNLINKITQSIDNAEQAGIYCIVDWHILIDNDPNIYKAEAIEFFDKISKKYSGKPHILYEICNEPNGSEVTWDGRIKPYAEEIIKVIRKNDPLGIIIVGTPNYSNNPVPASESPLQGENIMYTLHFYSGRSGDSQREMLKQVLTKIPIFVTEWGTTDDDGGRNHQVYPDEVKKWIDLLNLCNISWANWNFSDFNEGSAAIDRYNPSPKRLRDRLTPSGKLVVGCLDEAWQKGQSENR